MTSFSFSKDQLTSLLPKRTQSSNKGTYGRLLVIGGSDGMCGAPYFTAKAAYRSGIGLVEIFSSAENRIPLQTLIPEAVLTLYDARSVDLYSLEHSLERADAVAIGMGLSQNASSLEILKFTLENCKRPLLMDADALNLIAKNASLFDPLKAIGDRAIITPHLMEMSRLIGREVDEIARDVPAFAQSFANEYGTVCLLKDHNTAVAKPFSEKIYINQSGNSGMSTAGSGDVLDGVIGALLGAGLDTFSAGALGAYIHGLAGERAARSLSEYSVMASDIIDALPSVFLS